MQICSKKKKYKLEKRALNTEKLRYLPPNTDHICFAHTLVENCV